jgi:hypothetical protein
MTLGNILRLQDDSPKVTFLNCLTGRAAMPYGYYQHDQLLLLQFADNAVVPHSIPPQSKLASSKRFAKVARVFRSRDPIVHVIEYFPLDRPVEPLQIL